MFINFQPSLRLFTIACFLLALSALLAGGCAGVAYAQTDPELFETGVDNPVSPPPDDSGLFETGVDNPVSLPSDLPTIDPSAPDTYIPLTPIPQTVDKEGRTNLNRYVIGILYLSVGVAAALAVLMMVIGGVQYMTSEAVGGKSAGKERITAALQGLGLILFGSLLLYTIDPSIRGEQGFLPTPITVQDPTKLQAPAPPTQPHTCSYGLGITLGTYQDLTACKQSVCESALVSGFVALGRCVPATPAIQKFRCVGGEKDGRTYEALASCRLDQCDVAVGGQPAGTCTPI